MNAIFDDDNLDLSWPEKYTPRVVNGTKFTVPENIFSRIDDEMVAILTDKYAPKKMTRQHQLQQK